MAKKLGTALVLIASLEGFAAQVTQAIQLRDGTVYFTQPPQLIKARTTDTSPGVPATYYFTLSLPKFAGEPLQRVTLTQQPARENIKFNFKRTRAAAETPSDSQQKLTLAVVTSDRQSKTISVIFDPPAPPDRTVTIALRSVSNPLFGGVYLFGVISNPVGCP